MSDLAIFSAGYLCGIGGTVIAFYLAEKRQRDRVSVIRPDGRPSLLKKSSVTKKKPRAHDEFSAWKAEQEQEARAERD